MVLNIKEINTIAAGEHMHAATQERSIKMLQAYTNTGVKLLQKKRLDQIRIPDIAKRSGYSTGGFYTRFKDKEAFFKVLQLYVLDSAQQVVEERLGDGKLEAMSALELVEALVNLLTDIFTSPGRGVLRESFLRIHEEGDAWAPMRNAGREIQSRFLAAVPEKFPHYSRDEALTKFRFCYQTVVGVLHNDLVNDNHVFSTSDGSVRDALVEMLSSYMDLKSSQNPSIEND